MRELSSLVDDLTGRVTRYTDKLRADLDDLRLDLDRPLAEGDHDRILRLIEEGDTVTAEEFLALAGSGQQLPDRPDDENAELRAFLAGITGPGAPRPGGEGVHAGWWADRYGSGSPLTPNAQTALDSWRALCTKKGRNSNWQQHIPRVLRLLGLEPASFAAERMGQGVRRFKGRATVTEGAGYVAALGSRATTYTVLLVWEEQRADGPSHTWATPMSTPISFFTCTRWPTRAAPPWLRRPGEAPSRPSSWTLPFSAGWRSEPPARSGHCSR